jgi:hypothetical protein
MLERGGRIENELLQDRSFREEGDESDIEGWEGRTEDKNLRCFFMEDIGDTCSGDRSHAVQRVGLQQIR